MAKTWQMKIGLLNQWTVGRLSFAIGKGLVTCKSRFQRQEREGKIKTFVKVEEWKFSQVCAERRVCPTSCPPLSKAKFFSKITFSPCFDKSTFPSYWVWEWWSGEPTCGTDGVTYQSACHLQVTDADDDYLWWQHSSYDEASLTAMLTMPACVMCGSTSSASRRGKTWSLFEAGGSPQVQSHLKPFLPCHFSPHFPPQEHSALLRLPQGGKSREHCSPICRPGCRHQPQQKAEQHQLLCPWQHHRGEHPGGGRHQLPPHRRHRRVGLSCGGRLLTGGLCDQPRPREQPPMPGGRLQTSLLHRPHSHPANLRLSFGGASREAGVQQEVQEDILTSVRLSGWTSHHLPELLPDGSCCLHLQIHHPSRGRQTLRAGASRGGCLGRQGDGSAEGLLPQPQAVGCEWVESSSTGGRRWHQTLDRHPGVPVPEDCPGSRGLPCQGGSKRTKMRGHLEGRESEGRGVWSCRHHDMRRVRRGRGGSGQAGREEDHQAVAFQAVGPAASCSCQKTGPDHNIAKLPTFHIYVAPFSSFHFQEVGGKYVKHKLRLHMSETSCSRWNLNGTLVTGNPWSITEQSYSPTIMSREVVDVYSDPTCVLRQDAPDNYCEVTILESMHSNRKRVSWTHEITNNLKSSLSNLTLRCHRRLALATMCLNSSESTSPAKYDQALIDK